MRVVRVDVAHVSLGLRAPYTIAYETVEHAENVFVQVVTDGPHVGLGCAAPDAGVTGETIEACEGALRAAAERMVGLDPLRRAHVAHALAPEWAGCPAAAAAIDMALHDLLGKVSGQPVWRLLGGHRTEMPTSVTIGIAPVDVVVDQARRWVGDGFTALKLKGGMDLDQDVEVVFRVREAVGPDVALRFDANQGYTRKAALAFLERVEAVELELIEQPTPRGRDRALGKVTQAGWVPVMADESLLDLADVIQLARGELVDLVNIKLMKVGGLDAALQVNAVARAAGMAAMVGCMDESGLAIGAGLALALARPNVRFADLDGHLDLVHDPGAAAVRLDRGVLYPADGPGLGLSRLSVFG